MKTVVFKTESGSPDSPEWHAWRRAGIGGSDAPVIAHDAALFTKAPPWMDTINGLYLVKLGQRESNVDPNNWAIRRGRENEAPALALLEQRLGIRFSPGFGEMDSYEFIRSSFDGLSFEMDALAEIKVPGQKVHNLAKFGRVVDYYKPQIAHQALTAWGHPDCWSDQMTYFASYQPETSEIAIVDKPAKDYRALAEKLLVAECKFWERVQQSSAPCGQQWLDEAARYIKASEALDLAKKEVDSIKAGLIGLLGTSKKIEGGGVTAFRSPRVGAVDYTKLLNELLPHYSDEQLSELLNKYRKDGSESVMVKITQK